MYCTKTNCKNIPIKNRKRCEAHIRRTKPATSVSAPLETSVSAPLATDPTPLPSYEPTDDEYNHILRQSLEMYERRLLIEEQNKEYEEAVKKDVENMHKLEEQEREEKIERERLEKLYTNEDEDDVDVFNVKFKFYNFTLVKKFKKLSTANYIIDYVKYVLQNKNIKHENLALHTNYPKISIDKHFDLSNLVDKNTVIYVSYDIIH